MKIYRKVDLNRISQMNILLTKNLDLLIIFLINFCSHQVDLKATKSLQESEETQNQALRIFFTIISAGDKFHLLLKTFFVEHQVILHQPMIFLSCRRSFNKCLLKNGSLTGVNQISLQLVALLTLMFWNNLYFKP